MFSHVLIISKHSKADWFCIWSAFCTIFCCRQEFQCVTCQTVIKWVVKKRILRFFPLQRDRGGSLMQVQCAAGYCLPSDCPPPPPPPPPGNKEVGWVEHISKCAWGNLSHSLEIPDLHGFLLKWQDFAHENSNHTFSLQFGGFMFLKDVSLCSPCCII